VERREGEEGREGYSGAQRASGCLGWEAVSPETVAECRASNHCTWVHSASALGGEGRGEDEESQLHGEGEEEREERELWRSHTSF
jgi:hypothetical protein